VPQQQMYEYTCTSDSKSVHTRMHSWTMLLLSSGASDAAASACVLAGSWRCSWQISSGPLGPA
jgi:hypothetical protein